MKVTQEQALEALDKIEDVCQNLKRTLQNVQTIRQYIEGQGWQDIESAPKDETVIICFDEPFFGEMTKETFYGYYDSEDNDWFFKAPWSVNPIKAHRVTHWQPLPEPPKESE